MINASPFDESTLNDTVVIVTGASQGIGREIAATFAEAGASVGLAARSDGIYETREYIDDDQSVLAVKTDVSDEESVRETVEDVVDKFGGLDCVVNNAGIAGPTAPIEDIDREAWEQTMDVNVTGMFLLLKHAAPHLRVSDRGSVVNLSSISGKRPLEHRSPYTASKMAVLGLTRTVAAEFADDDVTVNAICPGPVNGPRIEDVIEKQAERMDVDYEVAKQRTFTEDAILNRLVDAEDIANIAVYLASEAGRNVTAQDINVDAGTVWY
ncbi:SDR family NAD(P)-dependent oxidoreductase [Halobium palmae]|uniref:SDR family NAD(P)-dependent oxidoreductase n=1 Tax=Halobium palmae TaxID=1776492 RepID=A0ABD5RUI2_9EURY